MKALETFAIYATPFLILGAFARIMMRRYVVDLTEVQEQAGSRRARRIFLLGELANSRAAAFVSLPSGSAETATGGRLWKTSNFPAPV